MSHDTSSPLNVDLSDNEQEVHDHLTRLERTLAHLTEQVQRLQRLASLGTLSLTLAHEFNNLLTPLLGGAQSALSSGDVDSMRKALDQALTSGRRLSAMCDRMLGMGVDPPSAPAAASIAAVVREAVDCLIRDLSRDSIILEIDIPEKLSAAIRPAALQQVLFNLLLNARHAMTGTPGKLRVSARRLDDARVQITVDDTGRGIRPEHLDHIFEPFFTTKQNEERLDRGGVGLGLHVSRQLVQEAGGDIRAASRVGEGTTMIVTLPSVPR